MESLKASGVPFNIATTSVCEDAGGHHKFFPTDATIHSGESDFNPPRFKPDPNVYLKAAEDEKVPPSNCVTVEDFVSGVGSAANAKIGLIVAYARAPRIPEDKKKGHANSFLEGAKSKDGSGAEIVITDKLDLLDVGACWADYVTTQNAAL